MSMRGSGNGYKMPSMVSGKSFVRRQTINMKVLVVLCALAVATVSAGVTPQIVPVTPRDMPETASIEGRITNGRTAYDGQFPYQVGLSFSSGGGGWWCGGSLLSNYWIVTAAHCTSGASSVTAYLGALARTNAKVVVTVNSGNFRQHSNYNSNTLNNDISLIQISYVAYSSYINKVALPKLSGSYSTYAGQRATASGWGKTSDNAGGVTNMLQYQIFDIVSVATCQATYGSGVATSNVICISTPNQSSTCQGDSGGPLVLDSTRQLVGVTSFVASAGCQSGRPAGFTRVTSYLDWIRSHTGIVY